MFLVERSYTNRARGVVGESDTTSVTVRLPKVVVEFMDSHRNGRIKNRSEFLQHWATVGKMVGENAELSAALDWALGEAEPTIVDVPMEPLDPAGEPDGQASACKAEESGSTPEPASEPPPIPPFSTPDELAEIREAQLETLRNRVR